MLEKAASGPESFSRVTLPQDIPTCTGWNFNASNKIYYKTNELTIQFFSVYAETTLMIKFFLA